MVSFRDAVMTAHEWVAVLFLALAVVPFGLAAVTRADHRLTLREYRVFGGYLVVVAVLAWVSVLIGAYLAYPFYRAKPPAGLQDLGGFPQRLLMADPATFAWHGIGMEWKEHVAWFAPILLTAAASIFLRYGARLARLRALRNAVIAFAVLAFASAAIAGLAGAMIYQYAPVGGDTHHVVAQERAMVDDVSDAPATGPGAAAILSAAAGCLVLSVFALAGDAFPSIATAFTVWTPTGPLSGVTDGAIIVWLATWFALARLWAGREVDMKRVNRLSGAMLVGAFLLTFPPVADLLQGK